MFAALGPLLASFIAMDLAALKRKMKRNVALYGIAGLFLLTAYSLLVAALAVYLGRFWGAPVALLIVGVAALVLALIMVAIVVMANSAEEQRKRELAAAQSSRALAMTAAVSAAPMVMKARPLPLILLAAAGGLGFLAVKNSQHLHIPFRRRSRFD
jgi:uncharacterized membrane protein (DUF485 family)